MQSSSVFCIEEVDASEFLQEDFDLDFTDEQQPLKGIGPVTASPAPKKHRSGFGKFTFNPSTVSEAVPETSHFLSIHNGSNSKLCSINSNVSSSTVDQKTAQGSGTKCQSGFQKFEPDVLPSSSGDRIRSVSSRFIPSAKRDNSGHPSGQRQQYLSFLSNLQGVEPSDGQHRFKIASLSSCTAPTNPCLTRSLVANGESKLTGVSSVQCPAPDAADRDVVGDASRGFQRFQKPSSQFLCSERTRSSPVLANREDNGEVTASSVTGELPSSDNISEKSVPLCSPGGGTRKSVFVPVSGSSNSDSAKQPILGNASPPFSSVSKKTGPGSLPGSKSCSPPFLASTPLLSVSDLSSDELDKFPKASAHSFLLSTAASGNGQPSLQRTDVQSLRPAGMSSISAGGVITQPGVATSSNDGGISKETSGPPTHHRLGQILDVRREASPSNQFQKRNNLSTPTHVGSPVTAASSQFKRQGITSAPNNNRPLLPRSNSSSLGPSRPLATGSRYPSLSTNHARQRWASPNPRAPFSGQWFTPGQPRTPQTPFTESISSPKHPVLTPRVAQLCKTPTGPAIGRLTRSSRKFPGPAGILPKLSPGQKLSSIKLSPPTDEKKEDKEEEPTESSQSSQSGIDDFSQGAWATMKKELDLDEGDKRSILAQHTIASVLRKASMKQLHRNKVPHICVMVKRITLQASDAVVTFRDHTGEMQGTLHKQLVEEYQGDLKPGCVLLLRQVGVLSPSLRNHYFNVTHRNVVQIFPPEHISSQKSPVTQTPKRARPKSIRVNCDQRPNKDETNISRDKTDVSSDGTDDQQLRKYATNSSGGNTNVIGIGMDVTERLQGSGGDVSPGSGISLNRVTLDLDGPGNIRTDDIISSLEHNLAQPVQNSRRHITAGGPSTKSGTGLHGAVQEKRASESSMENKCKRICVGSSEQGPGQKENVYPGSLTISGKKGTSQIPDSSLAGEENIADLIDGFEDELFADF